MPFAVINFFTTSSSTGLRVLSLTCASTLPNPQLQWESRAVTNLEDGILTASITKLIEAVDVTYFSMDPTEQRLVNLTIHPFVVGYSGFYTCRPQQSNLSTLVYATLTNPLWEVAFPGMLYYPVGAEVSNLVLRYGDSSVGYEQRGSGFNYKLTFLPCVATQPVRDLLANVTDRFSSELRYTFRVRLDIDSGEYLWNGEK